MDITVFMSSVLTPILVAIIGGAFAVVQQRNKKQHEEEAQKRDEHRKIVEDSSRQNQHLTAALLNLTLANARGTIVLLRQAHGEKLNGNVEAAMKDIESGIESINDIMNGIAASSLKKVG